MVNEYCKAKERLTIKGIILGFVTLYEARNNPRITLSDLINRFLNNAWTHIKKDKDTQTDLLTFLTSNSKNCRDLYYR